MATALQLTADYFICKPKNFFSILSTAAYWGTLSPRSREVALRTTQFFDQAYDAFIWPDLVEACKGYHQYRTWKCLSESIGLAAAATEFLHSYLKVIDLGKKLPAIQMVATLGDLAYYGIDLYERCTIVDKYAKNPRLEKILHLIKNITCLAVVISSCLAASFGSAYRISFTVHLLLDTAYYGADFFLFHVNPQAK